MRSYSELVQGKETILAGLPWDMDDDFLDYLEDRRELYENHGIGDGPTGILFGTVVESSRNCDYVWVWCWEDPADFQIQITGGGGGSGGSYQQPWQDNYSELRFCEGVNELYDTGPDNPSNLHPNAAFCTVWMMYLDECILPNQPEFSEYTQTYDEMIMDWAQFQYTHPDLFTQTIQDPTDCVPTGELDEHLIEEECRNALSEFETAHGITLNRFLRFSITGPGSAAPCTDPAGFEAYVWDFLLLETLGLTEAEAQLLHNDAQLRSEVFDFLGEEWWSESARQAASIYMALHINGLFANPDQPSLTSVLHGRMTSLGLTSYTAISAAAWMQIFATERAYQIEFHFLTGIPAWLQSIQNGITQGWDIIQNIGPQLQSVLQDLNDIWPETQEEWEMLAVIFWELGLDIVPEILPGIGEYLSFKNSFVALQNEDYFNAGFEFTAGLLGILPVGKVGKVIGKATKVVKHTFKSLRLVKKVRKFFSGLFQQLIHQVENFNWTVRYDGATDKIKIIGGSGDEVIEIENDIMDFKKLEGFLFFDIGKIKSLLPITPTGVSGTYIGSTALAEKAMKIKVSAPSAIKNKVDEIMATTDTGNLGNLGEELSELLYDGRNGFQSPSFEVSLPSQIPGGNANGFDNVFIKYGPNNEVEEIIINEAKVGSGIAFNLNGSNFNVTPPLPVQMSNNWIDHVLGRMVQEGGDLEQLAGTIESAKNTGKLTKTVTFIKKPSGEINILRLDNF